MTDATKKQEIENAVNAGLQHETEAKNNAAGTEFQPNQLGAWLREKREAAGLSVQDLMVRTNRTSAQINAIENGQYDYFSAPVMVRGIVKQYARVLDLDASSCLSLLPLQLQDIPVGLRSADMQMDVKVQQGVPLKSPWASGLLLKLIAGILAILLGYWLFASRYFSKIGAEKVANDPQVTVIDKQAAPAPQPTLKQSDNIQSTEVVATQTPATPVAGVAASNTTVTPQPTAAPASPAATTAPVNTVAPAPTPTQPAVATSTEQVVPVPANLGVGNPLLIKLTADSWVRVEDQVTKKFLVNKASKGGELIQLASENPVKVVIGNAKAIGELNWKGQALDSAPFNKGNVVTIKDLK